jgi:hypothetical protein
MHVHGKSWYQYKDVARDHTGTTRAVVWSIHHTTTRILVSVSSLCISLTHSHSLLRD